MSTAKPFTLRVYLTGICAIVPDSDDFAAATGATVVLPGKEDKEVPASPDNSQLRPHDAMVMFNLANVVGASAARTLKATVPLNLKRVHFDVTEADPESNHNHFRIVTDGPASISNLINLDAVAPSHCLVDPTYLTLPASLLVQAHVHIDQGKLFADTPSQAWQFPSTLSGKPMQPTKLAHQAVVELTGLNTAKLVAVSFDGTLTESISFAPSNGNGNGALQGEPVVEVTIVNNCADCKGTSPVPLPDEDFKWYFQLLPPDRQADLVECLNGLPLPIPYPILPKPGEEAAFINYGNCYPVVAKPAPATARSLTA
jgi:hypothetical protein